MAKLNIEQAHALPLDEVKRRLPDQDEVVLLIPQGLHEPDRILTSLELFATKVMPRFG